MAEVPLYERKRLHMPDTEDGQRYCKACRCYHPVCEFKTHCLGRKYHVCKKKMKRYNCKGSSSRNTVLLRVREYAAKFCRNVIGVKCQIWMRDLLRLQALYADLPKLRVVPANPEQPLSIENVRLVTPQRRRVLSKLWQCVKNAEMYAAILGEDSIDPSTVLVK